jgi:hypothetical protein
MITIKDFMEVVDYRITEGSQYMWKCYGSDAYRLDSWNGDHDGHSVSIVFDTKTQEFYEVSVYDYKNQRAYRLINPNYKFAHDDEASSRGVDLNQAWDDVNYTDLDIAEDFLEKAEAIVNGQPYDERVMIELDLPENLMLKLYELAHKQDITLNQLVENIIKFEIENRKNAA